MNAKAEKEYDFSYLWNTSSVAPSFGIMCQLKTVQGQTCVGRPYFYTPVYVLWDAIEVVRKLKLPTRALLNSILFAGEVDLALAALLGAKRDAPDPRSHFPGPEASFYGIVTSMRKVLLEDEPGWTFARDK